MSPIDKIRAPYNFVPLAPVFRPDETAELEYQDRPFADGIGGTLQLEIAAESAIFVRGTERADGFFKLGGAAFALPGTSLRGMIRAVVELASASKMSMFNDHAYSIRDLTPAARPFYGEYMAEIRQLPGGKTQPVPLVSAGWLKKCQGEGLRADGSEIVSGEPPRADDIVAYVDVCDFAQVEYAYLKTLARARRTPEFEPGQRQRSLKKYEGFCGSLGNDLEGWRKAASALTVGLRTELRRSRHQISKAGVKFWSEVGYVKELGEPGTAALTGTLVFTGQPNEYRDDAPKRRGGGGPKHHDFVFYRQPDVSHPRLPVQRETLLRFRQVHADRGQQNRLEDSPNPEWRHWQRVFEESSSGPTGVALPDDATSAVPVFFLPRIDAPTQIRAMGLAMMFRLSYDHTIRLAVENAQSDSTPIGPDLATAVFGTVDSGGALRGRIAFESAPAVPGAREAPAVRVVLGTPRASYFPNYFDHAQPGAVPSGEAPGGRYRTLMSEGARIRGAKRYRARLGSPVTPPPPPRRFGNDAGVGEVNDDTVTQFTPLEKGVVFRGKVRVHNLRPFELGAVLWALDFGGAKDALHLLGLAKSFGFGRVRLRITDSDLDRNDGERVDAAGREACIRAFVDAMDAHFGGVGEFARSETVRQLIACATPADPQDLRHMELRRPVAGGRPENEFVEAKKVGLTLAPATPWLMAQVGSAPTASGPTREVAPRPAPLPRAAPKPPQVRPMAVAPRGPEIGATLTAEVLPERTKKGGLVLRLEKGGLRAVLHPSSKPVPEDNRDAGTHLQVVVVTGGENPQVKLP